MGVSDKKQKTTQTTSQNTTSNSLENMNSNMNSSTNATNPSWVTDSVQGLLGQIGALGNPSQYVTGASPLQQQAFDQAGSLGTSGLFGEASNAVKGIMGAGAPGMTAAHVGPTAMVGNPTLGPAATAGVSNFDAAHIAPSQNVTASSLLEGLEGYLNPMLQGVVDTTLTGYDKDAAAKQAQFAAAGAKNGAFGGSRFGLAEGQLGADIVDNRAATEAGLRSNAYDAAFANSNLDAGRRQDASTSNAQMANARAIQQAQMEQAAAEANARASNEASMFNAGAQNSTSQMLAQLMQQAGIANAGAQNQSNLTQAGLTQDASKTNLGSMNDAMERVLSGAGILGGLGTAQDNSARANTGVLAGLGDTQRDIANTQAQAPLTLLQLQQAMTSGLPLNLFNGQSTTGNTNVNTTGSNTGTSNGTSTGVVSQSPSTMEKIGQAAQVASQLASLFSDRRLKKNVRPLGIRDGHQWYEYNYIWGGPKHEGVMADEVMRSKPEAVTRHDNGFLMVDYGRL